MHIVCSSISFSSLTYTTHPLTHETRDPKHAFDITSPRKCSGIVFASTHCLIDMHRWINSPNAFWVENNFTKIFCHSPPPAHPSYPLTLFYFSIKIRVNQKTSSRMYSQNVCASFFSCHVLWYHTLDTETMHHQQCSANIRCS